MPPYTPHWSLEQYIDFALWLSGSSFTVGTADEEPCYPPVPITPETDRHVWSCSCHACQARACSLHACSHHASQDRACSRHASQDRACSHLASQARACSRHVCQTRASPNTLKPPSVYCAALDGGRHFVCVGCTIGRAERFWKII